MKARATNHDGFLKLIEDSRGRNNGPTDSILPVLDPDGIHLCCDPILHRDGAEVRGQWLLKLRGQEEPMGLVMDNDHGVFLAATVTVEVMAQAATAE